MWIQTRNGNMSTQCLAMNAQAGLRAYANPILGYPGVSRFELYQVFLGSRRYRSGQVRERNVSTLPSGPNLGAVGSLCIIRGTFPGEHGVGGTGVNRVVGGWFPWCLDSGCVLSRFLTQRYLRWYKVFQAGEVLVATSLVFGVAVTRTSGVWSLVFLCALFYLHCRGHR